VIDRWVRELFPKAFEWLDIRFGCLDGEENEYQWVLLQKDRTELFVVDRETITGEDLRDAMGTTGRKWKDRCIRIGEVVNLAIHPIIYLNHFQLPSTLYLLQHARILMLPLNGLIMENLSQTNQMENYLTVRW